MSAHMIWLMRQLAVAGTLVLAIGGCATDHPTYTPPAARTPDVVSQPWPRNAYLQGQNLSATINQTGGWGGNTAWVTQDGHNATGTINQHGWKNEAGILQSGHGGDWITASITQNGSKNDGYIEQDGKNLYAAISQNGFGNEAVVLQHGNNYSANVTQTGYMNNAYVHQH